MNIIVDIVDVDGWLAYDFMLLLIAAYLHIKSYIYIYLFIQLYIYIHVYIHTYSLVIKRCNG